MVVSLPQRRSTRQRGRRFAFRLDLEVLETRTLPSVTTWPGLLNPVAETEPNDTLDQAQNLGDLSTTPRAEVIGTISNGPAGAGVDWYSFQLDRAANVNLSTPKAQASSAPVTTLSLYNSDPFDANDPYDPLGYRLVEQADSAAQGGAAQIERRLAPGTYYVAVSGSGNHYFHPLLAGSGYAGATGDYGLLLTAADLGLGSGDGPAVLAADPQPGATLDRAPFMIRVDVSGPLDPRTVSAGVQLLSNANGTFGDGYDQVVSLASANLNTAANEVLIAPAAPLAPGYYKVVLAGDSSANPQVLADPTGIPLGTSSSRPSGADFTYTFHVGGNEGNNGGTADDTPATCHQLGDLTQAGFVQIAGAIGDDSTDPIPFNGSAVNLYDFSVSGPGRYAFAAEVFAGRIGSPLSPGVTLFQVDPTTGQLSLLGSNAGTLNNAAATDGSLPLYGDPALNAGLQPGDYYLAVSNNFNVPDPVNSPPGTNGVFDPNVSHSGQNGGSTGNYVLNLQVQPVQDPPQVRAVDPQDGAALNGPPTRLTVQFSELVNAQQLAFQHNPAGTLSAVYIQGPDGTKYYPRLDTYDSATNQATFLMLDGLSNDNYELHLSGPLGLTDLAGNPLVGNDPSGDFVTHFTVSGPARGTGGDPLHWSDQEPNDDPSHPQDLGILFPHELQAGVTVTRDFTQNPTLAPADTADNYQIQVLQAQFYIFNFGGTGLPRGVQATLSAADGTPVQVARQPSGGGFSTSLDPGTYVLHIGDWTTSQAASVKYSLILKLAGRSENPVPLTVGPAPAISIRLVTDAPTSTPTSQVVVSPPATSPPAVTSTTPVPPAPTTSTPPNSPASNPPANTPPAPVAVTSGPSTAPVTPVVTIAPAPTTGSTTPASPVVATKPVIPTPTETNSPAPATVPSPPAAAAELPTATFAAATAPALPASSGSVAILVNLVAPAGVNNAGIAPALLRGTSDRPAESVSLPSSVLLALGAAPIGGIKDSTLTDQPSPADRVLVRLPDLSGQRQLQPGRVVIPGAESGTSTIDPLPASQRSQTPFWERGETSRTQGTTLLSQGIRQLMNTSYANALDAFFGMARWLEETTQQPSPFSSVPDEPATQDESVDFECRGATLLPGTVKAPPNGADGVLVNGLAALITIAVARPEKKQKSEIKRQRAESLVLSS